MSLREIYVALFSKIIGLFEIFFFQPKLNSFYRSKFNTGDKLVIFDVGANRGQSIVSFKRLFPHSTIFSFEPNKGLFTKLEATFRSKDIRLFSTGISEKDDVLLFHESILDETSTFEKMDLDSGYVKLKSKVLLTTPEKLIVKSYEVPVRSLDSIILQENLRRIDILKIDVEGHELAVVKGLSESLKHGFDIGFIQVEEHFDGQYLKGAGSIGDFLGQWNYREQARIKHGFGNFYDILYSR